jgi:phosphoglycerate-specific signal transduction histidine kinase
MPVKLATTISKIDLISNRTNSELVKKFYDFMRSNDASERHQNNNLKSVISFANFLGEKNSFTDINKSE